MRYQFPEGFLWGASTSAHQVEGNNLNDWTIWEKKVAPLLAQKHHQPAENFLSGLACNHYHLFSWDISLLHRLGLNAYRFSLEWSRIEPEEGKFNQEAISHYQKVFECLKAKGITPFVTLWHWTLPCWVAEKGGWENQKTIEFFLRYVDKVVYLFQNDVCFWLTLNEPEIYAFYSYLKGRWPPQKRSWLAFRRVLHHLILAHRRGYALIKKHQPNAKVGVAKNNVYFETPSLNPYDRLLCYFVDYFWNHYFLQKIKKRQDFIGLNYYFHNRIHHRLNQNENKIVSDIGWELYPEGIYPVLMGLKRYRLPIYITENGLADAQDRYRFWYIKETLKAIWQGIQKGVEVKGYFYWSLLDNFEWDYGFGPRFGLIAVDYQTMKRRIRPSAYLYGQIARENGFEE